ncbi:MAG TPA: hypothetical protein DCM14_03930, partial [Clostridiales bacterium UBA8153]|nr:hypothetical protein [Clostridiales bacterium UBA8153]
MTQESSREQGPGSSTAAPVPISPFAPTRVDASAACVAFALGFLFIRWVFFQWRGWGMALFSVMYCGAVILYLRHRGRRLTGEAGFWLAIV